MPKLRSLLYVAGAVAVAAAATLVVDLLRPAGPTPPAVGALRTAQVVPPGPMTLVRWDDVDLGDEVIIVPSAGFTARHLIRQRAADQLQVDPESGGGICGLPEDGVLTRMRRTDGPGPVLTQASRGGHPADRGAARGHLDALLSREQLAGRLALPERSRARPHGRRAAHAGVHGSGQLAGPGAGAARERGRRNEHRRQTADERDAEQSADQWPAAVGQPDGDGADRRHAQGRLQPADPDRPRPPGPGPVPPLVRDGRLHGHGRRDGQHDGAAPWPPRRAAARGDRQPSRHPADRRQV